ncbi:VacJ family lipoprotein [Sphingomonas sp. AAP5]|nr:VacJ family lipoprotein [Sphingomonas sp. AAP5]
MGEDARAGGVAVVGEWHQTGLTDPDGIHVSFAESNVSSEADSSKRSGVDQGDIVVTGRKGRPDDPLAGVNAKAFEATQTIDRALVGPVALAYKRVLPPPVRSGLRNFLYNLHEPNVFVNYLLQLKPGKAVETLGRFALNSTLGVGGLVDVAKRRPFKLPRRPNGFADTFGFYGIKNGPFLYLPLIGPTTLRDFAGGMLDRFVLPVAVGSPFNQLAFSVPVGVLSTLDHRAEFDDQLHVLHDGVADPYATSRDFYLRRRQQEIDHIRGKAIQSPPTPPADATAHVDAEQTPAAQALVAPGDRDRHTTKMGDGA